MEFSNGGAGLQPEKQAEGCRKEIHCPISPLAFWFPNPSPIGWPQTEAGWQGNPGDVVPTQVPFSGKEAGEKRWENDYGTREGC